MLKRTILTTAALTLVAVPALAGETMKSGDANTMKMDKPAVSSEMKASTMTAPEFLTRQAAGEVRAEQLIGTKVINTKSEDVGSIDDLVVSKNDGIVAAVISVGGFLGVGDKLVAVNANSVSFHEAKDNTLVAMIDKSKADLEAAPSFRKSDTSVIENMKSMLRDDDSHGMSK